MNSVDENPLVSASVRWSRTCIIITVGLQTSVINKNDVEYPSSEDPLV